MSQISENIRNYRLLHGLSLKQLGVLIDRVPTTVSNWERGEKSPDAESITKLCEVFEITPNQLFGLERSEQLENFIMNREAAVKEMEKLQEERSQLDARIKAYQQLLKIHLDKPN